VDIRRDYYFVDGHDSHWDAAVLQYLLDNNVYVFFLQSQNSINDQPNDMGSNSKLQNCFDKAIARWREYWPGITLTKQFFNKALTEAYANFLNDKKLSLTIEKSFIKAGLTDIATASAAVQNDKKFMKKMAVKNEHTKAKIAASEALVSDKRDIDRLEALKKEPLKQAEPSLDHSKNSWFIEETFGLTQIQPDDELCSAIVSSQDEHYVQMIRAMGECYYAVSFRDPARALRPVQAANTTTKTPSTKMSLKNPDTTTGLAIGPAEILRLQAQDIERARLASSKRTKKQEREHVLYERVICDADIYATLVLELQEKDWKKVHTDILKASLRHCYHGALHIEGKSIGSMNKNKLVEYLAPYMTPCDCADSVDGSDSSDDDCEDYDGDEKAL
jgi:hypothetical protein